MVVSTLVALTLSPAMCAAMLRTGAPPRLATMVDAGFRPLQQGYRWLLEGMVRHPFAAVLAVAGLSVTIFGIYKLLPQEYTPPEDRGNFRVSARGPEGASYEQSLRMGKLIEDVMMEVDEAGEAKRILLRVPGSFRASGDVNSAFGTVLLKLEDRNRRSTQEVMAEVNAKLAEIPGYRAFCMARSGLLRRSGQPVQFVITGSTFAELTEWRDAILAKAVENPGLVAVDSDYKETKPQLEVEVDTDRAADLGCRCGRWGARWRR